MAHSPTQKESPLPPQKIPEKRSKKIKILNYNSIYFNLFYTLFLGLMFAIASLPGCCIIILKLLLLYD